MLILFLSCSIMFVSTLHRKTLSQSPGMLAYGYLYGVSTVKTFHSVAGNPLYEELLEF